MPVIPIRTMITIGDWMETESFLNMYLSQQMVGHNTLDITFRRDRFEEFNRSVFAGSEDLIGETIKIEIQDLKFNGIISKIDANLTNSGGDTIRILAYGPEIKLTGHGHCRTFESKDLNGIVTEILHAHGITNYEVNCSLPEGNIGYVVQYNASDMEFLSYLAQKYGQHFFYDGEKLYFGRTPSNRVALSLGQNLLSFNASLSAESTNFKLFASSYLKDEILESSASGQNLTIPGAANTLYRKSQNIFSTSHTEHINTLLDSEKEIQSIDLTAKLYKATGIGNMLICTGTSDNIELKVGTQITVSENIMGSSVLHGGEGFIISQISHVCDSNGNYTNSFMAYPANLEFPPYTNALLTFSSGTQNAIVTDNKDPMKLGRIRVKFAWQNEGEQTPWIRVISAHAGPEMGSYIIPEINDEVMVGFEGNNIEKPYIIGSVYNKNNLPDDRWYSDQNDNKVFRTRSGHTVMLIDKDGEEEVIISDLGENYSIKLSSAEKTIEIKAEGDLTLKGDNVTIEAKRKLSMNAIDIEHTAQSGIKSEASQIEHKGSATLKLSASGQTEISGAMVKIN